MLTLCYSYYNQPQIMQLHQETWEKYSNDTLNNIKVIVVDDGSKELPLQPFCISELDLRFFKIDEDIYWNVEGAKNLAAHTCTTEWMLQIDLDYILTEDILRRIIDLPRTKGTYYVFNRSDKIIPNMYLVCKEDFWAAGGYDEDFSGYYGCGGPFMRHCLQETCKEVNVTDFCVPASGLKVTSDAMIKDKRDSNRNLALYSKKVSKVLTHGGRPLRFTWAEVKV